MSFVSFGASPRQHVVHRRRHLGLPTHHTTGRIKKLGGPGICFFLGGTIFGWKYIYIYVSSVWDTVGGILCWWSLIIHPDQFCSRLETWCCLFSKRHVVKIQDPLVDSRECRWFPNGSRKTWSPVNKNRCVWNVPTCKFRISCCTYILILSCTSFYLYLDPLKSAFQVVMFILFSRRKDL